MYRRHCPNIIVCPSCNTKYCYENEENVNRLDEIYPLKENYHGPLIDMLLSTDLYHSVHVIVWMSFTAVISKCYIWVDPSIFGKTIKPLHGFLNFFRTNFHSGIVHSRKIIYSFKKFEVKFRVQRALLDCGPWSKQKWYTVAKIL